jgi:flagellar protein FlbD
LTLSSAKWYNNFIVIKLHRLNGTEFLLNADIIESVEAVPDTVINTYTNNRFIVKETMDAVQRLVIEYRQTSCKPVLSGVNTGK